MRVTGFTSSRKDLMYFRPPRPMVRVMGSTICTGGQSVVMSRRSHIEFPRAVALSGQGPQVTEAPP